VAENEDAPGWGIGGGMKLMANWCKILNNHGHEAVIATLDGSHDAWLKEPPTFVSLDLCHHWITNGREVQWVIPWLVAAAALEVAEKFYYFEAEIAYTTDQNTIRIKQHRDRILGWATNSRYQQARYMAHFGIKPVLIVGTSDHDYWFPVCNRINNRIGFMIEGPNTLEEIRLIRAYMQRQGVCAQFIQIQGVERDIIHAMQQCDIFLGMNPSKHPLWGEGCPRSQHEAMHCGCVVIAYDVLGNREYLMEGYTGFLVPPGQPETMAKRLVQILKSPDTKERIRSRGIQFTQETGGIHRQWLQLKQWLNL